MDNNTPELVLYYNHNYDIYGQSYLVYCKDGGRYLCSKKSSFRIVDKRNSEDETLINVDNYAASRGFYKVLELKRSDNVENYYIQWNTINIPGDIKEILRESNVEIVKMCRRGMNIQHDPYVVHFYCMMNTLLSLLP